MIHADLNFGDIVNDMHAVGDRQCCFFVETIFKGGKSNPQIWCRLTDGCGNFWERRECHVAPEWTSSEPDPCSPETPDYTWFVAECTRSHLSMITDRRRLKSLYSACNSARHINGDMMEVGVFGGSVTRALALMFPHKKIHACDTFTGISKDMLTDEDDRKLENRFVIHDWLDGIKEYFEGCDNIVMHPGRFEQMVGSLDDIEHLSFVHFDADLYLPCACFLDNFWHRVSPGGSVLFDDYGRPSCPGIMKAVDEFFAGRSDYRSSRFRGRFQFVVVKR